MSGYLRVVPGEASGNGPQATMGTKVITEGGEQIRGVYKIVLTAEVNNLWRAEIHCHVLPTDISAMSQVYLPSHWDRIKQWLARWSPTYSKPAL